MSAYVVSDSHISALVGAMARLTIININDAQEVQRVGQLLLDANIKSVQKRYPNEAFPLEPFVLSKKHFKQWVDPILVPVYFLKALECYAYQSDIPGDWMASEANRLLSQLRNSLIRKLPGYDSAPWGIDD